MHKKFIARTGPPRHTNEQGRLGYQLLSKEVTTICIDFCVLAPRTPCDTSPQPASSASGQKTLGTWGTHRQLVGGGEADCFHLWREGAVGQREVQGIVLCLRLIGHIQLHSLRETGQEDDQMLDKLTTGLLLVGNC